MLTKSLSLFFLKNYFAKLFSNNVADNIHVARFKIKLRNQEPFGPLYQGLLEAPAGPGSGPWTLLSADWLVCYCFGLAPVKLQLGSTCVL